EAADEEGQAGAGEDSADAFAFADVFAVPQVEETFPAHDETLVVPSHTETIVEPPSEEATVRTPAAHEAAALAPMADETAEPAEVDAELVFEAPLPSTLPLVAAGR